MNSNPTLIASTGQPVKCPSPGGAAKPIRNLSARLLLAAAFALSLASAQAADQFFAGDGSALTASKWGTSGGPYTDTFTNGNTANFGVVNGTGAGAGGISVGGLTATENFTYSSPSGTLLTGGAVVPVVVSAGKLLDLSTLGISTAAGVGFTKSGDGAFATAGNTYAGGFTLNAGSVILRGDNALGSGGSLTISSGAIGANATRNPSGKFPGGITISGNFQLGILSNAVSIASDTANITFNNNMALGAATRTITIGANGTYTLGGIIGGDSSAVGLTVNALGGATGSLKLTGVNTYLGLTTINGGTLYLGHASDTLDGDITVNGGTLNVDNPDTVGAVTLISGTINGDSILTGTSYALESGTVSIVLAGSGVALTKSTAGTVTNSAAWTYTGATAIQDGTVVITGSNDRLPKTTAVTLGSGVNSGVLQLGDATTARNQSLTNLTTSGSGTGNAVVGAAAANSLLTIINNSGDVTYGGVLGGAGANQNNLALTKTGAGRLILSGSNTYSGATLISSPAVLRAQHNNALGDAAGGTAVSSGGALELAGNITIGAEPLGLNGTGISSGGALRNVSGNNTYGGYITNASSPIRINSDADLLTLTGTISSGGVNRAIFFGGAGNIEISGAGLIASLGTSDLTKDGAGTLTFSGANTYTTGKTIVNDGTLKLGANEVIPNTSAVTIAKGALDINGRTETISASTALTLGASSTSVAGNTASVNDVATGGTLILGGNVLYNTGTATFNNGTATIAANLDLNNNIRTFTIGDSDQTATETIITGNISGGGSSGALTKKGAGVLILSGANTYSGDTLLDNTGGGIGIGSDSALPTSGPVGTGRLRSNFGTPTVFAYGAARTIGNYILFDAPTIIGGTNALEFTGTVDLGGNTGRIITVSNTANTTFSGPVTSIVGGTGGGLVKAGPGTLILSGANNYTNNTTVNNGTLQISQAVIHINSTVSVAAGAVLNLGFSVTNKVAGFITNGVALPAGVYGAANVAPFIAGLGSLEVMVMGPSLPAVLTNSYSGGVLSLSWPAGQGWRLQMQTNSLDVGLATNWVQAADSSVSSTNIVTDSALPTVFYRLTYP